MKFYTNKKVSPKGQINLEDLKSWGKQTLIFASPLLLIFLYQLQAGKSWEEALPVVYGVLIQTLINLLLKFNN